MVKKLFFTAALVLMAAALSGTAITGDTVYAKTESVRYSGGTTTVEAVYAHMSDRTLRMEVVPANNQIGTTASLADIAHLQDTSAGTAVAAINGTFFTAYTDMQPVGALISKGAIMNVSDLPSTVGFDGLNGVLFGSMKMTVTGAINGDWTWPNNWYAWGMNHVFPDGIGSIEIFTPAYGPTTGAHNKTSIVVRNGVVVEIIKGEAPIYGDGYTIVSDEKSISARFSEGDTVAYKAAFSGDAYNVSRGVSADWGTVRSAMSCGPTLVSGGVVIADGAAEGFTEAQIVTDPAQRSFIGCTAHNTLIMATVPSVTMKELGEIALAMGCLYAINLDGGGSSGLYYEGGYMTTPGRELSCALVLTQLNEVPINIRLNGALRYYDVDPYVKNQRTMLPMRGILEDLGAQVFWEGETGTITALRGSTVLTMTVGSATVYKNGVPVTLDTAVELHKGRACVPVRFMAELFGGTADYKAETGTVDIVIR